MLDSYDDILSRIEEPPKWWDRFGCPRWRDFDPDNSSNIYADRVVLMRIACQGCDHEFLVEFAESRGQRMIMNHRREKDGYEPIEYDPTQLEYGDPPDIGCCAAGPTMSSCPREIVGAWERENFEWKQTHKNVPIRADWDDEDE